MSLMMMTTCSVDLINPLVHVTVLETYLRTRKILLLKIILSGSTLIKKLSKGRQLKFFSVNCHRIPIIWKKNGLIPKWKIGF